MATSRLHLFLSLRCREMRLLRLRGISVDVEAHTISTADHIGEHLLQILETIPLYIQPLYQLNCR